MDDITLQELERELKALAPRRPSPELHARLERELGSANTAPATAPEERPRYSTATSFGSWKWAGWQWSAAAAAALLLSLGVWRWQSAASRPGPAALEPAASIAKVPATSAERDAYRPVAATNVLYDMRDEGPVSNDDNAAARRMRYRYLDTYTWKNPATHASLKWSVPREEVRIIPASFQ